MSKIIGRVRNIAINDHKLSFELAPDAGGAAVRVVLYSDPPNTAIVPQMTMATRSWMLSLIQTAFTNDKPLTATVDANNLVTQIDLDFRHLTINVDVAGSAKLPG